MPAIPVYQQQRLASSAVGTPGVDPSAGKAVASAALFAEKVGKAFMGVAETRSEALATADANKRMIDFEIKTGDIREATKVEFKDNPKKGEVEFQNRAMELFNTTMSSSDNARANRMFSTAGRAYVGEQRIEYATFRRNQEVVLAKDNLVDANNLLALEANKVGRVDSSPAGLQKTFDLMDRSQSITGASEVVLGVDEARNLSRMGPESIARGYLEGLMDQNPEFALKVLDNPDMIAVFDEADDVLTLRDDALKKVDDLDKKADKVLTKKQNESHFSNMVGISNDPEGRSEAQIRADVKSSAITPAQGLKEFNLKMAPADRKSVESIRAEGTKLQATGELTEDWISDNAEFLSDAHVRGFADALTIDLTKQPAFKAGLEQIDAEIDELSFGFRTVEDDKLYADAAEAYRLAVVDGKNASTAAQEQVRIVRDIKAKLNINKKANSKARKMKRKMGNVVTTTLIEAERIKIEEKVRKNQMSQDEALLNAEALEILESEVQNAE